jgi:chromosome segregation ATPase
MNTFGKILVVFVTASSLGFLAFVIAYRNGGPDWQGEMRSADLQQEFVFATEPGEIVKYSSKHRRSETTVADKLPVLAEVVLKSRKRLEEDANKKLQELQPQMERLTANRDLVRKLNPIDDAGVHVRIKNYEKQTQELVGTLNEIGSQFSVATLETQDLLRLSQERREEAYRLANQLELLRNDQFSAIQQQKVLEDELVRLEENHRRLDRRQKQLKQQLGDVDSY